MAIFVNFNTGYYEAGEIIMDKVKIAGKYKKYLIFDAITLVSLISYIISNTENNWIHFLVFFKFISL